MLLLSCYCVGMLLWLDLVLSDLVYPHRLESGHVIDMFLCYYYYVIDMFLWHYLVLSVLVYPHSLEDGNVTDMFYVSSHFTPLYVITSNLLSLICFLSFIVILKSFIMNIIG